MTVTTAADLYSDVPPLKPENWRAILPGLTIVCLGTLAAGFLSDHYGAPLTLMALLLGLALNFLSSNRRLLAGLGFASQSLLRWGIVLVGAKVTAAQIAGLGPAALLCVAGIVAATIAVGIAAARRLGFDAAFGVLAGGSVAICGASAAMALATTLGRRRVSDAQLTLVLVGISAMSAAAMILYPIAAHALEMSSARAGFFLGASIHDVAQALGAGYAYSDAAGQIATIVKLSRVALLAPVLAIIAFVLRDDGARAKGPVLPWYVGGFFALAGFNSLGLVPAAAATVSAKVATAFLAAAVTATAIKSPLPKLLEAGTRPLFVVVAATLAAFALALAASLMVVR